MASFTTESDSKVQGSSKPKPPNAGKGRKPGVPNKLTKSAREAFQLAFKGTGGVAGLITWAKRNPTAFYTLYARLIPVEHVGEGGTGPIATVVTHVYENARPQPVHESANP